MKIWIISKLESYWSLQNLTESIISAIKSKYDAVEYFQQDEKIDLNEISKIYRESDIVFNLSSKCMNYQKDNNKVTVFLWHAWMDHWAWINLYRNRAFFWPNDVIAFASKSARSKFNHVYWKSLKTVLLPYFTTFSEDSTSVDKEAIKTKYWLPTDKQLLLYHWRICEEKNIIWILDVFDSLQSSDFSIAFAWSNSELRTFWFWKSRYDSVDYADKLSKHINDNRIKNAYFLWSLERRDLRELISASYLNINLSVNKEEDFWISAIESMALWIPVVTSDWWWLKDINSWAGYCAKSELSDWFDIKLDYEGVRNFIDDISTDKKRYQKISERSLKKVKKKFSESAFVDNFEKILKEIKKKDILEWIDSHSILKPKKWIEKIYLGVLKSDNAESIYIDNPRLFNRLYKFYASKRK
ncbi:MAG: hypothetical protein ACD_2C00016G0003 [uncultured bacterium (gcode 4)]|uniref:Glycosyl transferase family 1 domain-containing protein n=1 Tax=uncultured bacterium (gcode 4) TaxID=1234023 RepID=K2G7B8_9BACT|nr:MAG: hypothetical protein ACD_2C00016G0003 [uncultured bacterium (gcode 4)]